MSSNILSPLFELGQIVITSPALRKIHLEDIFPALERHAGGDWGNVTARDRRENLESLSEGFRLVSDYLDRNGSRFLIITEEGRSQTVVKIV